MALVTSGLIAIGGTGATYLNRSINLELSLAYNANSNLNQTNFRSLAGVASGTISLSDFYGKSAATNTQIQPKYLSSRGANCASVCETEDTNIVYTPGTYANFLTQTNLYSNSGGTANAASGWYSNGISCRQWNGSSWSSALSNC
jgi:hypothetical protein